MHNDLNNLLQEWVKSPVINEARTIDPRYEAIAERQSLIILTMSVKITVPGLSKVVTERRFFHTQHQDDRIQGSDPKNDVLALKKLMELMEWEFLNKQSKAFDELIQQWNPDGFF